jgi:hypothetical protein
VAGRTGKHLAADREKNRGNRQLTGIHRQQAGRRQHLGPEPQAPPSTPRFGESEEIGGIVVVHASRRALRAFLSMREVFDGIKKIPHPEEAAKRPSRRTHRADPANR